MNNDSITFLLNSQCRL